MAYICSAQFRNCAAQITNFQFVQLLINCARHIAQFVNSDLGLVPRPRIHVAWLIPWPRTCSLAAVTQLGWKLHYSPAAVIQPPLSLRCSRSRILQRLTALINYARELATVAGLSLTLAFTLGSWPFP